MDVVVEAGDHRTGRWKRRLCPCDGPWREDKTKTKMTKRMEVRTMGPCDNMDGVQDAKLGMEMAHTPFFQAVRSCPKEL